MSMLSIQITKLREKADMLDGLEDMDNLVSMLREAADTIEGLRERLQDTMAVDECEWVYPQSASGWVGYAECSNCGYRVYEDTIDEREWTCCPHCRAWVKAVRR